MTRPLHGWIRPDGSWLTSDIELSHRRLAQKELSTQALSAAAVEVSERRDVPPQMAELFLRGYIRILGAYNNSCGVELYRLDRLSHDAKAEMETALLEYGCGGYDFEEFDTGRMGGNDFDRPMMPGRMYMKKLMRPERRNSGVPFVVVQHKVSDDRWEILGLVRGAETTQRERGDLENDGAPQEDTVGRLRLHDEEIELDDGEWVRVLAVRTIYVAVDYRRLGIATVMYEHAARLACSLGMSLASDLDLSDEALSFWEKQRVKRRAVFNAGRHILICPPPTTLRNNPDMHPDWATYGYRRNAPRRKSCTTAQMRRILRDPASWSDYYDPPHRAAQWILPDGLIVGTTRCIDHEATAFNVLSQFCVAPQDLLAIVLDAGLVRVATVGDWTSGGAFELTQHPTDKQFKSMQVLSESSPMVFIDFGSRFTEDYSRRFKRFETDARGWRDLIAWVRSR